MVFAIMIWTVSCFRTADMSFSQAHKKPRSLPHVHAWIRILLVSLSLIPLAGPTGQMALASDSPAHITDIKLTNGIAHLTVVSPLGLTNRIECIHALTETNWSEVTNLMVTVSPYFLLDSSLTNIPLTTQRYYRVVAIVTNPVVPPPPDVVLIPAGSFTMGNTLLTNEGQADEFPTRTVSVSSFHIGRFEVSKVLWDEVVNWAGNNGYIFANTASGKATNHPVQQVTWYDTVKWCNARSEKEGRVPAYYTDAAQTAIYRSGTVDIETDWVKWNEGYRLPTEAEWERASRGGSSGMRFPWSDTNSITHARANYFSSLGFPYPYEMSSPKGYHPIYNDGIQPYTCPVGSFPANAFGLHETAGNVWEWCWDRYDEGYYAVAPSTDPRGPATGSFRTYRGGSWAQLAEFCRNANRSFFDPAVPDFNVGFRVVLPANGP